MKKLRKPKKYSDTNVEFYGSEVGAITGIGGVQNQPTPTPVPTYSGSANSSAGGSFGDLLEDILNSLLKGNK